MKKSITLPPIKPVETPLMRRLNSLTKVDVHNLPETYQTNDPDEEICLDYVDHFRKQFAQLYPNRSELILVHKNECGTNVSY